MSFELRSSRNCARRKLILKFQCLHGLQYRRRRRAEALSALILTMERRFGKRSSVMPTV